LRFSSISYQSRIDHFEFDNDWAGLTLLC